MDKRQVIAAYRRGLITIQECAQIIGVDSRQATKIIIEDKPTVEASHKRNQAAAKSM